VVNVPVFAISHQPIANSQKPKASLIWSSVSLALLSVSFPNCQLFGLNGIGLFISPKSVKHVLKVTAGSFY